MKDNGIGFYLGRIAIYALLVGFAWLMLFPFTYMMMSSLKTSDDVFHAPPRLLPYSPETTEIEGEQLSLFEFEVDGQVRQMVPTDENIRFGFFTTEDLVNVEESRESEILYEIPLEEATELREIVLTSPDGEEDEFDVYEITVDGETLEAVLAFRGSQTVFVDPNDPTMTALGVERTATPIENVEFQFSNYDAVFDLNLDRALVNTTLVTIGVVAGQLITSIFGGYAFSRLRFRGRDALFLLYLGSIMIPFVVLVIPMYRLMVTIGWEGKLVSLIVPWIFTAYGTFLMRQFFLSIPKELEEAALMDGASRMRILWTIFVPLSTPAVATLAIFSFLYAWNSFLWPLLIIGEGNEANHVLTLSLIRLSNAFADQPNFVLTGAAVAILPPIIIFVLAQRYFIEGVASSGLKG
ncbi:MAG: ABC transporter permease subunit [Chloroflexota bacterium]